MAEEGLAIVSSSAPCQDACIKTKAHEIPIKFLVFILIPCANSEEMDFMSIIVKVYTIHPFFMNPSISFGSFAFHPNKT